jgi:hypothetical protein
MRFKVGISGEHLDRARSALNRADIATIGPLYYWLSKQEVIEGERGLLAVCRDRRGGESSREGQLARERQWQLRHRGPRELVEGPTGAA